jgi:hypothetical protein
MRKVLGGRQAEVKLGFEAALRCGSKVQLVCGLISELGGAGKAVGSAQHQKRVGAEGDEGNQERRAQKRAEEDQVFGYVLVAVIIVLTFLTRYLRALKRQ